MKTKHLELDECRDGRTFGQYAQARGADVTKVGSHLEIKYGPHTVYIQDSSRPMLKEAQNWAMILLIRIGLGAMVLGVAGLIIGALVAGFV